MKIKTQTFPLVLLVLASSCESPFGGTHGATPVGLSVGGSSGAGLVMPSTQGPGASSGVVTPGPNFAYLNQAVFQNSCIHCHSGGAAQPSPDFTSYSTLMASKDAILPGSPATSLVYMQVSQGFMPQPPYAPVSATDTQYLSAWITAGAPDSPAGSGGNTGGGTGTGSAPSPNPSPSLLQGAGTASVRNYAQILSSMETVTGVAVSNAVDKNLNPTDPILQFYQSSIAQLPATGNATEVSPSVLLVMSDLASLFCQRSIQNEMKLAAAQRTLFGSIDFTQTQSSLTPTVRQLLFQQYAASFYGRDIAADESATLSTAIDESMAGVAQSTAALQNALIVTCSAALGNVDFLRN